MKKFLRRIKRFADKLFGTRADEFFWRFRHIIQDKDWAESYISEKALEHSHRKLLLQIIDRYSPFEKVLELGCASGPNLILLSPKYPNTSFLGIDISEKAIKVGQNYIEEHAISNISLKTGNTDEIKKLTDKSFDVIFTDAMLIYIGPEKIKEVLKEMVRVARRAIILVEWCSEKPHDYVADHWSYNWEVLFKDIGIAQTKITRLNDESWEGEWAKRGCIVEASLK